MTTDTKAPALSARNVAKKLRDFALIWNTGILEADDPEGMATEAANLIDQQAARIEQLDAARLCAIADHVAAEARATQAEAERDEARAALAAAEAREASMREECARIADEEAGDCAMERAGETASSVGGTGAICMSIGGETTAKAIAHRIRALASPAQGGDIADPLVTAYNGGVDHAWGVAQPLAEAAEDVINWCDFATANPSEFDAHGVRNLTGPAFDKLRERVSEARSAGLLPTETREGRHEDQ